MNSEEDEFNRIELEASLRKAAVKFTVGKHTIDMAKEVGFPFMVFDGKPYLSPELERLVAAVRADEREQALAAQPATEDSSVVQSAPAQPKERDIRNATLDEIATKIDQMPFGDTAASFAVWIRDQKQ